MKRLDSKIAWLGCLLAVFLFGSVDMMAQPANDNCDGTVTVTAVTADSTVYSISGDNTGATDALGTGLTHVWEAFTLTDECSNVYISFCSSENPPNNVFISVTDCPVTAVTNGSTDSTFCTPNQTTIIWATLPAGTYYYPVMADPSTGGDGLYTIEISAVAVSCASVPDNDAACDAIEIIVNDPAVSMDNTLATPDGPDGSCWFGGDPADNDIWATFVAPASGAVSIQTFDTGGNDDTQLGVYSSSDGTCTGTLTEVGCNDDDDVALMSYLELTDLTAGDTYWVQIDGYAGTPGAFDIVILNLSVLDECPNPTAVLCDNIDEYTLGVMNGQGAHWDTWSGTLGGAEDAIVSDEQAFSNTQSVLIQDGGSQDVILRLGDRETGQWTLDWKMYIPVGNNGYYNMQGANAPGDAFIAEVYFNQTNGTPGEGAWAGTAFTYPEGAWFDVQHAVDLDTDEVVVTIDGTVVGTFPYTDAGGDLLSGIDFFSADAANNRYYIDDVVLDGSESAVPDPCTMPAAYICDNIDFYDLGVMNGQGAHWDTWSGTLGGAEDAIVSDEQAFSNNQSVLIQDGGAQDVLLRLGDQSSGQWTVDWKMYVPVGNNAYYNFQGANAAGTAFIAEIYFNQTNGTPGEGAFAGTAFTYPEGEWFDVQHAINLDTDEMVATINGVEVGTFPYTVAGGDLLSAVDFFSADAANNRYYIDDVIIDGVAGVEPCPAPTAVICDNIDDYTLGAMNGQGAHWDTWSGTLGGAEDAIVSDEQAFSNTQSVLIADGGAQDVLLRLGDQPTGMWTLDWKMYVPVGNNGYYNFQGANAPGTAFIAEIYFNQTNGTPGEGTWAGTAFSYPEGSWFDVQHAIDLDADEILVTIDGTVVGTFPYTVAGGDLLSAVDFFSGDAANNRYYIDDVIFDGALNPDALIEYTEGAFTIYPNPTEDMLTISGEDQIDAVVVRNVLGAIVSQLDTPFSNNVTIDVSDLTDGVYFVEVRVGDVVNVSRVIKR